MGGEDEPAEGVHGGDVDACRVAEVEQDAGRFRVVAKGLLQTVGQRMGRAEEDVAAQLVGQRSLSVHPQDRLIGNGTAPAAAALASREVGLDRIEGGQPCEQEHDQDRRADARPDEEAEEQDRQEDQDDDPELRPGQLAANLHQPGIQQGRAGEQQHASDERRGHEPERRVAEDADGRDEEGGRDAREPRIHPEDAVAQGGRQADASRWSAEAARGHRRQTGDPELAVPVQFQIAGQLERPEIAHQAEHGHQHQGQQDGNLRCHDGPVHQAENRGVEEQPEAAVRGFGDTGEQETFRLRLGRRYAQEGENEVEGRDRQDEARGQDQGALSPPRQQEQAETVGNADAPVQCRERLKKRLRFGERRRDPHQGEGDLEAEPADAGDEAAGQGEGNEPDEVRQPERAEQHRGDTGGQRSDRDRRDHRCEQRVGLKRERGGDPGQDDERRRRRHAHRAAVAAAQGDEQADDRVAQQHEAGARDRVGGQGSGEDDAAEGDDGDDHVRPGDETEDQGGGDPPRRRVAGPPRGEGREQLHRSPRGTGEERSSAAR